MNSLVISCKMNNKPHQNIAVILQNRQSKKNTNTKRKRKQKRIASSPHQGNTLKTLIRKK